MQILSSITHVTVKILRPEKQKKKKKWFRRDFFHFQIFETFGNLEIGFSTNINKCFWIATNISDVTLLFVKISTHYQTDLKRAVATPSYQACCLTYIYSHIKFCYPKVEELHVKKSWYYMEYLINSSKFMDYRINIQKITHACFVRLFSKINSGITVVFGSCFPFYLLPPLSKLANGHQNDVISFIWKILFFQRCFDPIFLVFQRWVVI